MPINYQVLRKLSIYDRWLHLGIYVAMDNMLILEDIDKVIKTRRAVFSRDEFKIFKIKTLFLHLSLKFQKFIPKYSNPRHFGQDSKVQVARKIRQ